jgi:hypothetical protein
MGNNNNNNNNNRNSEKQKSKQAQTQQQEITTQRYKTVTFTYHSPLLRRITNLFKQTDVKLVFAQPTQYNNN